jgi:hypothetical protein
MRAFGDMIERRVSRTGWVKRAGVSNPEISDLTHNEPQSYRHDCEGFVPGEDFLSLWCTILSRS